jgi:hypothetical protein
MSPVTGIEMHGALYCKTPNKLRDLLVREVDLQEMVMPFFDAIYLGNHSAVVLMLGVNEDLINASSDRCCTPLEQAVLSGSIPIMKVLLSYETCEIDSELLHYMCGAVGGWYDGIKLIAEDSRTQINHQDKRGNTPLHYAYLYHSRTERDRKVIELLERCGANKTIQNNVALTPSEVCVMNWVENDKLDESEESDGVN